MLLPLQPAPMVPLARLKLSNRPVDGKASGLGVAVAVGGKGVAVGGKGVAVGGTGVAVAV